MHSGSNTGILLLKYELNSVDTSYIIYSNYKFLKINILFIHSRSFKHNSAFIYDWKSVRQKTS